MFCGAEIYDDDSDDDCIFSDFSMINQSYDDVLIFEEKSIRNSGLKNRILDQQKLKCPTQIIQ